MDVSQAIYQEYEDQEKSEAERLKAGGSGDQVVWCQERILKRTKETKLRFRDKEIGGEVIDGFTCFMLESLIKGNDADVDALIELSQGYQGYYKYLLQAVAFLRRHKADTPRKIEEFILDVATGAITVRMKTGRPSTEIFKREVCDCIDFLNYRVGVTIEKAKEILAESTGKEFSTIEDYWKKKSKIKAWAGRRSLREEHRTEGG